MLCFPSAQLLQVFACRMALTVLILGLLGEQSPRAADVLLWGTGSKQVNQRR